MGNTFYNSLLINLIPLQDFKQWGAVLLCIVIIFMFYRILHYKVDDNQEENTQQETSKDYTIFLMKIDAWRRVQIVKQIEQSQFLECYSEIPIQDQSEHPVNDDAIYLIIGIKCKQRIRTATSRSEELQQCFSTLLKRQQPKSNFCDFDITYLWENGNPDIDEISKNQKRNRI